MTDRHDKPALNPAAQARAEAELDSLFAAARHSRADLDPATPDLLARILGDAEAEQDAREGERLRAATGASVEKPRSAGRWSLAALLRGLGGWPAAASLVAATMAGVWIGVDQPAGMDSVTGAFIGSSTGVSSLSETGLIGSEDMFSEALLGEYGFNAGWSAYEGILADG